VQFTSITFVFYFLPAFLVLYLLISKTFLRNLFLLAASIGFYAWGEFRFVPLLILSAAVNYGLAPNVARRGGRKRTALLWTGIALNLAPLVVFKYGALLLRAGKPILDAAGWRVPAVTTDLPLGISFYTFKAISYLVDVYRKDTPAERDPVAFAAYLTMFPQILAGPIERMADAAAELRHRRVTLSRFRQGAQLFIAGMAAKMLIANTLAVPADAAFSSRAGALTAPIAWVGLIAYTLQIYFDFAGYTNMAIGLGHMLGFTFPRNFNYPYAATSITDFWQRWHITLSTWLRDYLWFPLGANRRGRLRTYANLLLVFLVCGLWHGANYTFAVWGLFHGTLLAIERGGLLGMLKRCGTALATIYSVGMAMMGWVIFRSESLRGAAGFFAALAGANGTAGDSVFRILSPEAMAALAAGICFAYPIPRLAWEHLNSGAPAWAKPALEAAATLAAMTVFLVSLMAIAEGSHNPFLYFRF